MRRFDRFIGSDKCRVPSFDIPAGTPDGAICVTHPHEVYSAYLRCGQQNLPEKDREFPHPFLEVQENGYPDAWRGTFWPRGPNEEKQDRQYTYNVILSRVHDTTVAVEKQ